MGRLCSCYASPQLFLRLAKPETLGDRLDSLFVSVYMIVTAAAPSVTTTCRQVQAKKSQSNRFSRKVLNQIQPSCLLFNKFQRQERELCYGFSHNSSFINQKTKAKEIRSSHQTFASSSDKPSQTKHLHRPHHYVF